jgi:hypothetical protein
MVGYLPTTSKETYNVPVAELAVPGETNDIRLQELGSRFITPLVEEVIEDITDTDIALTVSVYLLVDLWDFLQGAGGVTPRRVAVGRRRLDWPAMIERGTPDGELLPEPGFQGLSQAIRTIRRGGAGVCVDDRR